MSEKLPSTISLKVNGEIREILMSYNKLNRCNFLLGDAENLPLILISPTVSAAMICEMLGEKNVPAKLEDLDIAPEEAQRLLEFVSQHLEDFMVGALEKATALQDRNKERREKLAGALSPLTPTTNGQGS